MQHESNDRRDRFAVVIAAKALSRSQALRALAAMARAQGTERDRMAQALRRFFTLQAARVVRRSDAGGRSALVLLPLLEDALLTNITAPHTVRIVIRMADLTGDLVGLDPITVDDPLVERLSRRSATRVKRVSNVTRGAIRRTLAEGQRLGLSNFEIAEGGTTRVRELGFRPLRDVVAETYRGRAQTIARSEMAVASSQATHDRYAEAGVEFVDISDGPGCGWVSHEDSDLADGSRRTLSAYNAFPTAHPNCVRLALPVI